MPKKKKKGKIKFPKTIPNKIKTPLGTLVLKLIQIFLKK